MPKKKSVQKPKKNVSSPRERLLIAAEKLFAMRGYSSVSIRNLAAAGRVNIGTIIYHFGTKEKLFEEVYRRLSSPVRSERQERVANIYAEYGDGVPDIRKMLEAVLDSTFRDRRKDVIHRRLAGRCATDPTPEVRRVVNKVLESRPTSTHNALRKCCPHLSRTEFHWRYFCYQGAVQNVLADIGRIQEIAGKDFDTSDPHVALKYVIPFLAAGMLAPGIDPPEEKLVPRASARSKSARSRSAGQESPV